MDLPSTYSTASVGVLKGTKEFRKLVAVGKKVIFALSYKYKTARIPYHFIRVVWINWRGPKSLSHRF